MERVSILITIPDIPDYEEYIGEVFQVGMPPFKITAPIRLKAVSRKTDPASIYHTMSLLFSGPEQPFVQQDVYAIMHPNLAPSFYLTVPVGKSPDGFEYEITITSLASETPRKLKEIDNG